MRVDFAASQKWRIGIFWQLAKPLFGLAATALTCVRAGRPCKGAEPRAPELKADDIQDLADRRELNATIRRQRDKVGKVVRIPDDRVEDGDAEAGGRDCLCLTAPLPTLRPLPRISRTTGRVARRRGHVQPRLSLRLRSLRQRLLPWDDRVGLTVCRRSPAVERLTTLSLNPIGTGVRPCGPRETWVN